MRKFFVFFAVLLFSGVSSALTLDQISGTETAGGLKEALTQGAGKAVELLGSKDGFLGNPKVKIGLPGSLEKAAKMMRKLGMGGTIDELETAMNRAAEAAVPEAKALLVESIKSMSVDDAKGILTGGDNAATEYFKRSTSEPLKEKFKPISLPAAEDKFIFDLVDTIIHIAFSVIDLILKRFVIRFNRCFKCVTTNILKIPGGVLPSTLWLHQFRTWHPHICGQRR